MEGSKIASEGRTCGQAPLSTASAGLRGQQSLALAQNRAKALGLLQGCLGRRNALLPAITRERGDKAEGTGLYLQRGSQSSESPTEINQPKVVKLDTTGSPPIGKEALLFSLL